MAATKVKKAKSKAKKVTAPSKAKKTKHTKKTVKSPSKLAKLLNKVKSTVNPPRPFTPKPPIDRVDKTFNKSQLVSTLAERTDLHRKHTSSLLEELLHIMGVHIKKGGPEKFIFPGAFKIVVRNVPAKKARTGINPFTGESTTFKAKPASRKVRIIPLKALKEFAHK